MMVKTTMSICTAKPNSAVIIALLPLHSGNDCSTVELRGLQQAAALRAVVDKLYTEIKRESNILMNIKIQDTCSSEEGAIKAALRSMVDSDQMCLHPPFFLGFIGPEEKNMLNNVYQITKLFNATHVVPYSVDLPGDRPKNSVLHITTKSLRNQAQSIVTVLHQLEWTSFSLAVGDSIANRNVANIILEMVQKDLSLCIINNAARITDVASIQEALIGSTGDGIVILADTIEMALKVIQANREPAVPMTLFLSETGLQTWGIPAFNSTLIILQETISQQIDGINESMNASLYRTYTEQQNQLRDIRCRDTTDINCTQSTEQGTFQNITDASILPISYAARLMASALIAAHKNKCRAINTEGSVPGLCSQISQMPSEEWQSILQKSTAFIRTTYGSKLPNRINFQMDIPSCLDIYVRNQNTMNLQKIGQINNGNKLKLITGHSFPVHLTDATKVKHADCSNQKTLQIAPTKWSLPPKETSAVQLEPVETSPEDDFYKMVALLCGAGISIFVFFVLVTYVVYASVRVKTAKQSSGDSPSVQRKPSRIARWRRGSGQSSKASIRTID